LGGDEFIVILEKLSKNAEAAASQAKLIAEKILVRMREPHLLDGHEYIGTCSIGITVLEDHQQNIHAVMQQADTAMYQAKSLGGNTVRFFSPELQAAVNARAALIEDLRFGIEKKQFLIYYQPQIENGHLIGAEALLRWQHPQRGILKPAEFLRLAEETRLIRSLGEFVLETVCRQIAVWGHSKQTASMTIAVNICAQQLRQPDFAEALLATIHRAGADPRNLELEFTETILTENVEEVIAKMNLLSQHGLRLSLDDFGTGFSSLANLTRLHMNKLKIDSSFVQEILHNPDSRTVAQTIIDIGRSMVMSVVAEGVETEEQRSILAQIGCNSYQGHLFSQALPLEEFERLLSRNSIAAALIH
jgi:EAL domain-containing protein (putative c-di-GMP-specific phosphodiesterase class I)